MPKKRFMLTLPHVSANLYNFTVIYTQQGDQGTPSKFQQSYTSDTDDPTSLKVITLFISIFKWLCVGRT